MGRLPGAGVRERKALAHPQLKGQKKGGRPMKGRAQYLRFTVGGRERAL